CLKPKSWWVFTIETHAGDGWSVGESARYQHGESYVRELAEAHNFAVVLVESVTTREERGQPVAGLAVVLKSG
ncbi:MAG: putative TPR repeat methyltransferase, partial [Myxococcota bacterium]